jgi:hypothetical protein
MSYVSQVWRRHSVGPYFFIFFSFIGGGKGFALIFQREKDNWARNFKRIKEADAGRVFPMDCQ